MNLNLKILLQIFEKSHSFFIRFNQKFINQNFIGILKTTIIVTLNKRVHPCNNMPDIQPVKSTEILPSTLEKLLLDAQRDISSKISSNGGRCSYSLVIIIKLEWRQNYDVNAIMVIFFIVI